MGSNSMELLRIDPTELHFPVEAKKEQISCSLHMTNTTDAHIAFKVRTTAPNRYAVRPNKDCATTPEGQCKHKFLVQSVVVREGTTIEDFTREMFINGSGNVVHEVKLKVLYVQPPPLRGGSEEGASLRPSSIDDGNKDYQDAGSTPHMSLQHLKDITNNFCKEGILGKGGFAVVYKGVLENGKMIAVKKLEQSISRSQEQFENEVNLLMKLKHPHIVELVGYCYEKHHVRKLQEGKFIFVWNTECLLCLECLPNGSLDKYISGASSGLDWPTRCKIIDGISSGLRYLHEQSDGSIIHLDLKPANILLDENMMPKITDFGLSRLLNKNQTIHTTSTSGTVGYMPPEYMGGIITSMSEIFSLGVIILEVITGRMNYPYDIRTYLSSFIKNEIPKWRNVLQKEQCYTYVETNCQQIKRYIQIGLICMDPDRTKRPTVRKVIDMLHGLESLTWYLRNESFGDLFDCDVPSSDAYARWSATKGFYFTWFAVVVLASACVPIIWSVTSWRNMQWHGHGLDIWMLDFMITSFGYSCNTIKIEILLPMQLELFISNETALQ